MKIVSNNNNNISIATGLVNPKTTSLFYDRIWIPDSLKGTDIYDSEYGTIPSEVKIMGDKETEEKLYYDCPFGYYSVMNARNKIDTKHFSYNKYITSIHRNEAILIAARNFKKIYGLEVTPFFFECTDFEQAFNSVVNSAVRIGSKKYFKIFENAKNLDVIKFTVDNISKIIEDKLTWEQVIDLRHDKNSVKKLRKFRHWCTYELQGKSVNEITEILNESYEEYCCVLKKYGIKTTVGSFTTILTSTSTIINMINAGKLENIATGFTLSASLITYVVHTIVDYIDYKNRKEPIAYIYDIIKESNKTSK